MAFPARIHGANLSIEEAYRIRIHGQTPQRPRQNLRLAGHIDKSKHHPYEQYPTYSVAAVNKIDRMRG